MAKRTIRARQRAPAALALERRLARRTVLWLSAFAVLFTYFFVRYIVLKLPALPLLHVGPLTLAPFGPLVAFGVLFGIHLTHQWCQRFGMDWPTLRDGLFWIVGGGFLVAHVTSIWMYTPKDLFNVARYLDPNTGLYSFGGVIGGTAATVIYCRRHGLAVRAYVDALLYGFTGGWLFGRLGCFSVHDHPGTRTDWPTGVLIRGVLRHDLGFYELLFTLGLFGVLTWTIHHRKPFEGFIITVVACSYAMVRFLLDFLRVSDATYGGLTPAQWTCVPLLLLGVYVCLTRPRQPGQT